MQRKHGGAIASALLAVCIGKAAMALDADARMSAYCTKHFATAEREYGIPKHLLMSISATESGRWNDAVKMTLPWPWTINANGEGHYFETKHDAVIAVRKLLAQGVKQIDVGCMQINLQHHPDAFASVGEAFDPEANVTYGAKFLKANYDDLGNWQQAIAAYHSRTPSVGAPYFTQVKKRWKKILAAIGAENNPYVHKLDNGFDLASLSVDAADDGADGSLRSVLEKNRMNAERRKSERMSRRMKIIKVTEVAAADQSPEILVIRPSSSGEVTPAVVVKRGDADENDFVVGAGAKSIKIVGDEASTPQRSDERSGRKKGPNFIFY